MTRGRAMGVWLALGSALLGGLGLAVHRRVHKLWLVPDAPSRSLSTEGYVDAPLVSRVHVLFVGHSLVNQDMPRMAQAIAASVGAELRYDVQLIDGGSLEVNWNQAERATGVRAREALERGEYDALVLTEAVNLDDHLRFSEPAVYAARWYALAREHRPDARLFFYETWHHRDEARHARGLPFVPSGLSWREHLDADLSKWEHIVDGAEAEHARERGPAAPPLAVSIVPGGQALAALVDALRAGQVPGVRAEDELFRDGVHLTDLGNYYIALVQVATLTHASLEGAANEVARADGELVRVPADTARALSQVAARVVRTYPRSGALVAPEAS